MVAWIGAAASVLGGLIGNSQRNKELAMQDPAAVRKRLENAGYNPRLYNGGGQVSLGYAPTFGQSIAEAGRAWVEGHYREQALQLEATALDLENQRLQAAINAAANNRGVASGPYQGVSSGEPSSGDGSDTPDPALLGRPSDENGELTDFVGNRVNDTVVDGWRLLSNPEWSSAQEISDNYGDVIEMIYGAAKLGADLGYTAAIHIGRNAQAKLEAERQESFGEMQNHSASQTHNDVFDHRFDGQTFDLPYILPNGMDANVMPPVFGSQF